MVATSKLKSIEKIISKTLIESDISYYDFILMINIRTEGNQLDVIGQDRLIEHTIDKNI